MAKYTENMFKIINKCLPHDENGKKRKYNINTCNNNTQDKIEVPLSAIYSIALYCQACGQSEAIYDMYKKFGKELNKRFSDEMSHGLIDENGVIKQEYVR